MTTETPPVEADNDEFPLLPDPLTHVLEGIRLRCMMPGVSEMTSPWAVTFGGMTPGQMREHAESLGLRPPPFDPPTARGSLLAVIRGSAWLTIPDHNVQLQLVGGDLVLITRPGPYTISDDPQTPPIHVKDLIRKEHITRRLGLTHGGGGPATTFLNGHFFFGDEQDNPLLAALPPVIHVRGDQGRAVPWLDDTVRFLTHELSPQRRPLPGAQSVVNHLAHILFIQAVRAHFAQLPRDGTRNWLLALIDPDIGPAIGMMHLFPDRPWTVASLADHTSMSRSAFAARFMSVVGQPPLKYLTDCRMRKARDLLRGGRTPIKTVSNRVGYATESAFSNAFKRYTGTSPGEFRRGSPVSMSAVRV